ncbi:MAG: anaerobic carbon-monoxide dehydrogenase iron sulfur subunit [Thermosediminibacterales bacterium]|nr:anaerobic carbon-monoxide dehydrogenase iron sulfur subunit [Thermosediminibacterales bacterium]MDK2836268.1 anaerobic carbon-monoxide dehydrogenase iron sulfur subunit [Thermosediminibacterales bacterium]
MKRIKVNETKCAGCRVCESFCAYNHEKVINPSLSRITIINPGILEQKPIAVVCRQCEKPKCAEACPTGALKFSDEKQMVVFNENECINCGACAKACPYGAITMHFEKRIPLKCDLCGGDPTCVKHCTAGAITLEEIPDEIEIKKKRFEIS